MTKGEAKQFGGVRRMMKGSGNIWMHEDSGHFGENTTIEEKELPEGCADEEVATSSRDFKKKNKNHKNNIKHYKQLTIDRYLN